MVKNLRGIKSIELSDLKDMVVVAGPNGCGKSSIFDAIRVFKTYYGSYIRNELQQLYSEFQIQRPNSPGFIRSENIAQNPSQEVVIAGTVELASEEKVFLGENLSTITLQQVVLEHSPRLQGDEDIIIGAIPRSKLENYVRMANERVRVLQQYLDQPSISGRVTIESNGRIIIEDNPLLTLIFSIYSPNQIGIIDFHSANRLFARQSLGSITLSGSATSQNLRNSALYNTASKYNQITQEMAGSYVRMLFEKEQGKEHDAGSYLWDSIHELFRIFFPDKNFLGPKFDEQGELSFLVETSDGYRHDINELSSGEKEIVLGYLRLYNSTPKHSIILLDEPELHLNPSLVRDLPDFYNKHVGKQLQNQIWLITHSDTLLRQAVEDPDFSVFHMVPSNQVDDLGNQGFRLTSESSLENAIVSLVGEMSQYSPGGKVILLEGENSEFDKAVISRLYPDLVKKVNLISVGSKANVQRLHDLLDKATKEAGLSQRFFSIVDRDSATKSHSTLPETNRFTWEVYHIENYLLEPHFIYRALQNLSVDCMSFASEEEIEEELKEIARQSSKRLMVHQLLIYVRELMQDVLSIKINPASEKPAIDVSTIVQMKSDKLSKQLASELSQEELEKQGRRIMSELDKGFDSEEWKRIIPGHDVLREFANRHVQVGGKGVSYEAFRNLILSDMVTSKYRPRGMTEVLSKIEPSVLVA